MSHRPHWVVTLCLFSLASMPAFATNDRPPDSPLMTALITWAPVIFLIGLWVFFMRRMGWGSKGGYREYMRISQEKIVQIEQHLADIAHSLKRIADKE